MKIKIIGNGGKWVGKWIKDVKIEIEIEIEGVFKIGSRNELRMEKRKRKRDFNGGLIDIEFGGNMEWGDKLIEKNVIECRNKGIGE